MAKKERWEPVLYRNFDFADNYSDDAQFLNQLRKNVNVVQYTLAESVRGACMVMSHVDVVALYLCVFESIQMEYMDSGLLLLIDILLVGLCGLIYLVMNAKSLTHDRVVDHLRTSATLILFGYGFTPIIRTLTTSISTDSIYAVSFGLFLFSLVFHDYGLEAPIVSSAFSANLSLAASVFLISRVGSDPLAFYLLALSLCAFCFWPRLRNMILLRYDNLPVLLLILFCPLSLAFITAISIPLAIIYAFVHLFLVVMCPMILVEMQKYKSTIHGPWDEVSLKASVN